MNKVAVESDETLIHEVSNLMSILSAPGSPSTYFNMMPNIDCHLPSKLPVNYKGSGHPHYKHAFNTQACEQLNAWLGGFQSILNKMTVNNFNWTLHALLFLHTQKVINKQNAKKANNVDDESDEDEEDMGIDIDRVE